MHGWFNTWKLIIAIHHISRQKRINLMIISNACAEKTLDKIHSLFRIRKSFQKTENRVELPQSHKEYLPKTLAINIVLSDDSLHVLPWEQGQCRDAHCHHPARHSPGSSNQCNKTKKKKRSKSIHIGKEEIKKYLCLQMT